MKRYAVLFLTVMLILHGCSSVQSPTPKQAMSSSPTQSRVATETLSPTDTQKPEITARPSLTMTREQKEDLSSRITQTPTLLPYTPAPTPNPPSLSKLQIINRTNVGQMVPVWRYEPKDNRPENQGDTFAFSPDGKTIAFSVGDHAELVDIEQGKTVQTYSLDHLLPDWATQKVYSLAFSPGGKRLAGLTEMGIVLWDVSSEKPLWITEKEEGSFEAFTKMVFSPGGDVIVTTSIFAGSNIRVWSSETGKQIKALGMNNQLDAVFSPDGSRLYTIDRLDDIIRVWDAQTWKQLNSPNVKGGLVKFTLSPNGKMVAVNSEWNGDGEDVTSLYLLDGWKALGLLMTRFDNFVLNGTPTVSYSPIGPTRIETSFNRDGGILALAIATYELGSRPDHIELWDTSSLKLIASLDETFSTPITWVAFSPDGRLLAARSENGTAIFWGVPTK